MYDGYNYVSLTPRHAELVSLHEGDEDEEELHLKYAF